MTLKQHFSNEFLFSSVLCFFSPAPNTIRMLLFSKWNALFSLPAPLTASCFPLPQKYIILLQASQIRCQNPMLGILVIEIKLKYQFWIALHCWTTLGKLISVEKSTPREHSLYFFITCETSASLTLVMLRWMGSQSNWFKDVEVKAALCKVSGGFLHSCGCSSIF